MSPIIPNSSPIRSLPDAIKEHGTTAVVAFARGSTLSQKTHRDSLRQQWLHLSHGVKAAGGEMQGVLGLMTTETGKIGRDRPQFRRALKMAYRKGALLVAEDVTRFLRADARRQFAEPTPAEWDAFWEIVGDVPLATIFDPTLSLKKLHAEKSRRGALASGKRIGRPMKVSRSMLLHILRIRERSADGFTPMGLHRIAERLQIPSRCVTTALHLKIPDGQGGERRLMDIEPIESPVRAFLRAENAGLIDDLLARLADDDAQENTVSKWRK